MSAELRIKAFELAGKFLGDDENVIDFAEEIYKFISADEPNIVIKGGCCPTEEPPLEDRVFTGKEALKMCLEDRSLIFGGRDNVFSKIDYDNTLMVLSMDDDVPTWSENSCAFLDDESGRYGYRIWHGGDPCK